MGTQAAGRLAAPFAAVPRPGQGLPPSAAHFGLDAWQRKDGAGGLPKTEVAPR
jgi:hypothetical protein